MTETPKLKPKTSKYVENVLEQEELLQQLLHGLGSPLNIILPEMFERNINQFRDVFKKHKVNGSIYYAHKANKSSALVAEAKKQDIQLDVASIKELEDGLKQGFKGREIIVTGPKNKRLLEKSILQECLISVDNIEEIQTIKKISRQLDKKPVKTVVRFSGFKPHDREKIVSESRFGIPISKSDQIIEELKSEEIEFKGFAFHLSTSDDRKKLTAISNIFQIHLDYLEEGLTAEIIDIGGSFGLNYMDNKRDWQNYINELHKQVSGERDEKITWKRDNFGLKKEKGGIKGSLSLYQFYQSEEKHDYLDKLLDSKVPGFNKKFKSLLQENMLELIIEPGRALLDEAGFTVTKPNFVKFSETGEKLIGLEMNQTNLNTQRWEFMVDPIILKNSKEQSKRLAEKDEGVFFLGNLCLETDIIQKHKTYLEENLNEKDLIIFPNTAAYHMDFGEATPIQKKTAQKAVIYQNEGKEFEWILDDRYSVTTRGEL